MPVADLLSPDTIRKICPAAQLDIIEAILTGADDELPRAGITEAVGLAHFFAQISLETGGLKRLDENLTYTTAERIRKIFPSRVKDLATAKTLVKNPQKLGNTVYSNKLGNGDIASGDGFRYRGSGLIQLTGRSNFADAEQISGLPLEDQPDLARQPDSALAIALAYWTGRRISEVATGTGDADVDAVTKRINPAMMHRDERRAAFRSALKVFRAAAAAQPPVAARAPVLQALGMADAGAPFAAAPAALVPRLSGAHWVQEFPTSRDLGSLTEPFRSGATAFVAALRDGGASVKISATLRPPQRAWLMHWAWKIARLGHPPDLVQPFAGIPITWVHPTPAASRRAARDMVAAYGMAFQAALNGRHMEGRAIDMTLSWAGALTLRAADGGTRRIDSQPRNGANQDLWAVARGYGVHKLPTDPPHWSEDGR